MNIHYCSHVKYYTHTVYTQLTLVYIARGKRVYAIIATSWCWIILGRAWASSKLHLECPHRHAAIRPVRLLCLQEHGLSFTVKPWASKGIHAMYERSCQVRIWSQRAPCWPTVTCSLPCHAIVRLASMVRENGSESKLPCMLQMHSIWIVTLFHADPAVWQ